MTQNPPIVNDIFLAGPFSHPDPEVMEQRYREHCRAAAWLMDNGFHSRVFSSVAHSYGIYMAGAGRPDLPYWTEMNHAQLRASHALAVLEINGWKDSNELSDQLRVFFDLPREHHHVFSLLPSYLSYRIVQWSPIVKQGWRKALQNTK